MGLSGSHILLLIIVLVVLFAAPTRLPGLGKSLAQAIRGFKKGMSEDDETDVTNSVKREKLDERDEEYSPRVKKTEKDRV